MNAVHSEIGTMKNMKTSLVGEVPYGVCYQDSKTLNQQDIHQNLGL